MYLDCLNLYNIYIVMLYDISFSPFAIYSPYINYYIF